MSAKLCQWELGAEAAENECNLMGWTPCQQKESLQGVQLRVNEKSMQNPAVNTLSVRTDCEIREWITPSYRDVTVKSWGEHCVIETWQWNPEVDTALSRRDSEILRWTLRYRHIWQWNPRVNTALSRRASIASSGEYWSVTAACRCKHYVTETWL